MADDVHVILTREDRDALKRLLKMAGMEHQQQHPVNVPNREKPPTAHVPSSTMNTDVYVATGTVPARNGTEPGKATCDIHWIKNAHVGTPTLEDRLVDQVVFNVGTSEVSDYFPVARDKFGSWLVMGAGGGTQIIFFTIITANCTSGCASVTVNARSCGNSEMDDEVQVYDAAGCFLSGNEALLIGRKGYAILLHGENPCTGPGTPVDGCTWHIFSLCCPTEVC